MPIGRPRTIDHDAVRRAVAESGRIRATARRFGIDVSSVRNILRRNADPDRKRRLRDQRIAREYGLTPADVEALLEKQHRACAICEMPFEGERYAIDHNHRTGVVRGLLCNPCNVVLGHMRADDIEAFEKWASRIDVIRAYLKHASTPSGSL